MELDNKTLEELFKLADKIGKKRYHKLTPKDWEDYRKFDHWRYINGDIANGTTSVSQNWVKVYSSWDCPICETPFSACGGRSIDHKLPRSQYPWLSMDFRNFWVICQVCNQEKGEMHWFEYEHYTLTRYPDRLPAIVAARPIQLLKSLRET